MNICIELTTVWPIYFKASCIVPHASIDSPQPVRCPAFKAELNWGYCHILTTLYYDTIMSCISSSVTTSTHWSNSLNQDQPCYTNTSETTRENRVEAQWFQSAFLNFNLNCRTRNMYISRSRAFPGSFEEEASKHEKNRDRPKNFTPPRNDLYHSYHQPLSVQASSDRDHRP